MGPKSSDKGIASNDGEDSYSQLVGDASNLHNDEMINDIFMERKTVHAEDAVDYEDIDELAEDDINEADAGVLYGNDDAANRFDEQEEKLQQEADDEFDNMFGEDPGTHHDDLATDKLYDIPQNNNILFNDLSVDNGVIDDDGLHDFNMDQIFGEDAPNESDLPSNQAKRHASSDEIEARRQAKKKKLQDIVAKLEKKATEKRLAYYYPDFSQDKLYNNHLLFLLPPKYYRYIRPPVALNPSPKPLLPKKVTLNIALDECKLFKSQKQLPLSQRIESSKNRNIVEIRDSDTSALVSQIDSKEPSETADEEDESKPVDKFSDYSKDLILSTTSWDDDAIINAGDGEYKSAESQNLDNVFNNESNFEEDESIFEGTIDPSKFKLDMNDPNLILVPYSQPTIKSKLKPALPLSEALMEMKFSISNDKQYEILKKNYHTKVRSQLSNLIIEHSLPAIRLQTPYYKVKLSKDEARSFHRPRFIVRPGTLINFSRLKTRKRKKDRGKTSQELFAKSSDLTMADSAVTIGMEYAEEYPPILSNFGMGSKLINYYRKEKDDDNSRPKAPLGETHILGVEDRSPFWNFGYVEKGDFVPTLYNNMVRAPVFKHEPRKTDFLLIRSQGAGNHQRYYLKALDHLFAVGQLFPSVEIPAPHSRKVTNTSKNRLKMIIFRAMNANDESRVSVKDISHHFPDQNDMQNRQRLKEFMDYQRHGDDQGYWKIKGSDSVPTENEIKAMISPEDVAMLDSMQHGQQILEDLVYLFGETKREETKREYRKAKDEANMDENARERERAKEREREEKQRKQKEKTEKDKDDIGDVAVDEELAPWNSTRNFINANQSKAMLQLNGEGDPTGIGLGYSFLRVTQKSSFSPLYAPVKENVPKNNTAAYQQKLYEEEISRIWYSQRRSLTVDGHDGHNLDMIYKEYPPVNHDEVMESRIKNEKTPLLDNSEETVDNKVLRITRRIRDQNNIVQRRVETITDPRIIRAYLKRRKEIEDDLLRTAEVDDIKPTNDKELNKLRRKALEEKLATLERKSRLGKGRKSSKESSSTASAAGGTIIDANTIMLPDGSYAYGGKGIGKGKSKTRRCAACGAFGHIRTKKSCPLFSQSNGGMDMKSESNELSASPYGSPE
ncbi:Piso0_005092 [Millerozyma farinosa CBS 7064]|uniref:Piso0_005092 protein n=1 Tax=Pichia sorbitophila (strain ATCC MYA-4447 / BCRC 22081 / CBS 7064 / NBRC 10061 / NRRL Y-12695) TaxID=559304 RepID=G8Y192_PICSO|nr:Piso0_005092 [Millerozyma farinosa CBS 7064]